MQVRSNADACPDECPLDQCLQLLAGAWTHKVLWYLRAGSLRFGDLRRSLPGVSAKVLTTRLRDLELRGVLTRRVLPSSPRAVEHGRTPLGCDLLPVLEAIAAVGKRLRSREARASARKAAVR